MSVGLLPCAAGLLELWDFQTPTKVLRQREVVGPKCRQRAKWIQTGKVQRVFNN